MVPSQNFKQFRKGKNAVQIIAWGRDNGACAWPAGIAAGTRGYSVNGQNQYTAIASNGTPGPAFSYDANGNLTGDGIRTWLYDVENRLVSSGNGASLVYDPLGRLFQTSVNGASVTQFLYDGDALVVEYNGSGAVTKRYVHGPGADEPVAVYENPTYGIAGRRYMMADERGSIAGLVNANGTPSVKNSYDEYGYPGPTNEGRFQYTGQAWIPELGLYYYKARFYSPTLGRFMQVDPVGYEDDMNLYSYVGNDPLNQVDSTGLAGECPTGTRTGDNAPFCKVGEGYEIVKGGREGNRNLLNPLPHGDCDTRAQCDFARDEAAMRRGDMTQENFVDRMRYRGLGALIAASFFGGAPLAIGERVAIGLTEQASVHALRHVISRGLAESAARNAILRDARTILSRLGPGQTMTRTVSVQGRSVEYRIHRLVDGRINIGSIRPPRP